MVAPRAKAETAESTNAVGGQRQQCFSDSQAWIAVSVAGLFNAQAAKQARRYEAQKYRMGNMQKKTRQPGGKRVWVA